MTRTIDKYQDVMDSRDVIERIEELGDMLDDTNAVADELTSDEKQELKDELEALVSLQSEAEGYSEGWKYGATLIRDSYFQNYAQELADDIGATNSDAAHSWPLTCIDWDQAARELQQDYTSVEFDGVTYWVR